MSDIQSNIFVLNKDKPKTKIIKDKGKQIFEGLLLSQYQNSPNLKEYFMAFISEMDFLYEQIERVYKGRLIENAIGVQLDVIGIILQQTRAVTLPTINFGFQGAPDVDGMASKRFPNIGGIFISENITHNKVTPLDDITYKRVLLTKALIMNSDSIDINTTYCAISTLLGRIPTTFELRDIDSNTEGPTISKRTVELVVSSRDVTNKEITLIIYMSKYFIPAGITFIIRKL